MKNVCCFMFKLSSLKLFLGKLDICKMHTRKETELNMLSYKYPGAYKDIYFILFSCIKSWMLNSAEDTICPFIVIHDNSSGMMFNSYQKPPELPTRTNSFVEPKTVDPVRTWGSEIEKSQRQGLHSIFSHSTLALSVKCNVGEEILEWVVGNIINPGT